MTPVIHEPAEEPTPRSGTLLSVADYKKLRQIDAAPNAALDAQLELALEMADSAIEEETGRDFLSEPTTLTKKYRYNGSGVLDIDDASQITAITIEGWTLDPELDVIAGPSRGPMFWWLEFAFNGPLPNPESAGVMGFTSNRDRGFMGRANAYFTFIEITGTFGWADADIPASVKQAAAMLVDSYAREASDAAGNESRVTSESIADLGYGYNIEPPEESDSGGAAALPSGVRALLEPFRKVEI